jgi:flagellar basal body L-ring protein FlgH
MKMRMLLGVLLFAILLSGCAKLMGGLRRDLDDSEVYTSPTVGGRWTERGFLAEDSDRFSEQTYAVGHSERNPASEYEPAGGEQSWINDSRGRRDIAQADEPASPTAEQALPAYKYKNGIRATRADFVDDSQSEGSLWASDGQTNYYFTKNKVRGIGDIITLTLEQTFVNDVVAEAVRTLSQREKMYELQLAQEKINAKAKGQEKRKERNQDEVTTTAAAPEKDPAGKTAKTDKPADKAAEENFSILGEPDFRKATMADIDITKVLEIKAGDTVMSEIVERFPNGNCKIRGTKKVPFRGGYRVLTFVGVVRGTDISEEDGVNSGKLYEYRLEVVR